MIDVGELVSALLVAVVAATPPTVVAWSARRKVERLHVEVDGRLTQLLAETKAAASAEGEERGRVAAHRERADREADA